MCLHLWGMGHMLFSFLVPCASFHLQPGKVPAGSGHPALPLYFPVNRPMSPSRAQYFPQKFPISHPATGKFSTLTTFFADNFSCLRSVFHYLCKIITRYFVIYSCAILQLWVFNVFHKFSHRFHCGKVENIVQRHKSFTFTVVTSWLHASFIYYRQYRIILSADTASEVRQMPSQKRR